MLGKEQEQQFTINCIKDLDYVFLVRPNDPGNGNTRIVMLEINEEEEDRLERKKSLALDRGGILFDIDPDNCLGYGELDLTPNSEDMEKIDGANWFSRMYVKHFIPSGYDFETHTATSDRRTGRWFDTTNIKIYLPFLYACLNKPKRVVIFKEFISPMYNSLVKRRLELNSESYNKHKEQCRNNFKKRHAAKRKAKIKMLSVNFK